MSRENAPEMLYRLGSTLFLGLLTYLGSRIYERVDQYAINNAVTRMEMKQLEIRIKTIESYLSHD